MITHNDGGNKSRLFVLDTLGNLVKKIKLVDTKNKDWEDLTQDDKGNLYLGDFGNNYNTREKCQIYIIKKGFIYKDEIEPDKITFWYEDQYSYPPNKENLNFDCEAFFYKDGFLYLLTKCRSTPFTGVSNVYRIPAKKGKYKAKVHNSTGHPLSPYNYATEYLGYSDTFQNFICETYNLPKYDDLFSSDTNTTKIKKVAYNLRLQLDLGIRIPSKLSIKIG